MSNIFTLPNFIQKFAGKYITRSGGDYRPDDIALCFALSLRIHNSAEMIRQTAKYLVPKTCLEHQPNMKRLSREKDDAKVIDAALKIINRVCDMLDCYPGEGFILNDKLPPKLEPMISEDDMTMGELSRTPSEQILAQQRTIVDATKRIKELEMWEKFATYLVNNCEGQTVTSENLEKWLAQSMEPRKP